MRAAGASPRARRPSLAAQAAGFFLSPSCIACHAGLPPTLEGRRSSAQSLCPRCTAILHPIEPARQCPRCGAAVARHDQENVPAGSCGECAALPKAFRETAAVFPYLSSAGHIVRNMKYQRAPWLAGHLVDLAWPHAGPRVESWAENAAGPMLLLPVPMHPFRQLARGYNQAEEVAKALAGKAGLPLAGEGVMRRTRRVRPQARFPSREERLRNLAGLFQCPRPELVAGKSVVLVDDVMTSGATMTAASRVLLEAGAVEVRVFVLLRARLFEDRVEAPAP